MSGPTRGIPELRLRVETWRAIEAIGDAMARGDLPTREAHRAAVTLVHPFIPEACRPAVDVALEAWCGLTDPSQHEPTVWTRWSEALVDPALDDAVAAAPLIRAVAPLVHRRTAWLGGCPSAAPYVGRPMAGTPRCLAVLAWTGALESERLSGVVDHGTRRAVAACAADRRAPWATRVGAYVELAHPDHARDDVAACAALLRARRAWDEWPDPLDGARLALYVAAAEAAGVIRVGQIDVSICAPVRHRGDASLARIFACARTYPRRVDPAVRWTTIFPSLQPEREPTSGSATSSPTGSVQVVTHG